MKWINHGIVSGMLVYAATGEMVASACAVAGAIMPDKLEGKPGSGTSYWSWRSRHRGWSHWPVLYLAIIAMLLGVYRGGGMAVDMWEMESLAIWVMVGALLHILEDALCGKVPLLSMSKKIGVKLFTVGSFTEYFFAIAVVLMCYMWRVFVES